jgi:hypothetical protein
MFEDLGLDLDDLDQKLLIGSLFTDHNRNHGGITLCSTHCCARFGTCNSWNELAIKK